MGFMDETAEKFHGILLRGGEPSSTEKGNENEMYIKKYLEKKGFAVKFFGNKRGLGYDLTAEKDGVIFYIECKRDRQWQLTQKEVEKSREKNYLIAYSVGEKVIFETPTRKNVDL